MGTVEVDGLQIPYERAGSGPVLVLLHGYVGDGPTTYAAAARRLCDEFTVVAWGAPGAGRSTDPPEAFGLDDYAECLAAFLEKARSRHCVCRRIVIRRHPRARAPAPTLGDVERPDPGVGIRGLGGFTASRGSEQRLRQALPLADGAPEAFVAALLPTMFSKTMPRETVDVFRASMQAFHPPGCRAMARASAEDVREVLPHVDVPTLLCTATGMCERR